MERYRTLSRQEWNKWSEEERTRAFLITNAMNRRELTKKNEELIPELKRTSNKMIFAPTSSADDSADVVMYAVIAGMIATGFQMAERETSPSGDGSGGYSGGAGGAGGGGGGSGAF